MTSHVLYHCPCTSVASASSSTTGSPHLAAPTPQHPAHPFAFHRLPNLYFCEECDAVRCNRCVSVEVSGYYCPNCLFEVPSASVRAEKNRYVHKVVPHRRYTERANLITGLSSKCRCARNCFQCPHCSNTLSIVSSDPPPNPDPRQPPVINAVGEPPFFLYCNYCRWDSAEAGITFDKPTGLARMLRSFFFFFLTSRILH
jgi:dynactin-4